MAGRSRCEEEAKVLKTLTVTNAHTFVMKMPEAPTEEAAEAELESAEEAEE